MTYLDTEEYIQINKLSFLHYRYQLEFIERGKRRFIDNANGYGYRSKRKALRAAKYKYPSLPIFDAENKEKGPLEEYMKL